MNLMNKDVWLGIGTIAFGLLLLAVGIPYFVSSPSNVPALVLAPTFWPTIVGYMIVVLGAALVATRAFDSTDAGLDATSRVTETQDELIYGWGRLLAMAILMVALVITIPILGMVLASAITFALFALIVVTPRPLTSIIVAVVLPLVLYAFFSHVAGVSVPQGRFLTLP
jgi:putative tricarboxylic transport membrane protein